MKYVYLTFVNLYALFSGAGCFGQQDTKTLFADSTINFVKFSALTGPSRRTPFWLQANEFGVVSAKAPGYSVQGMIEHYWQLRTVKAESRWRLGGVFEVAINTAGRAHVWVPQAHISLRFKNWEFFIGRKKQWVGLADSTIGSGSYSWSTNSMPIPKIQVGTRRFVDIPLTGGWLSFLAFYSEGLFENSRPVSSHLKLHQKMLYFRLGNAGSPVKLYAGINHQVQWGGRSHYQTLNGVMPNGLKNYFRIVTGKPGDANVVVNTFDDGNRVGNHLGTIDVGMEIHTYAASFFAYRQNIYEDGSLYALTNIADGLNGVRMKRNNSYGAPFQLTEIVLEFLYTKSQGGGEFSFEEHALNRGAFGRDNYFNNAQIRDGWSYFGRTIGTPFITPTTDTDFRWPKYADAFTSNNRVSVLHLGLKGLLLRDFTWLGKMSFSSNSGTYDVPFSPTAHQFSGLISISMRPKTAKRTVVSGVVAADVGRLYRPAVSLMVSVRRDFAINKLLNHLL